MDLKVQKREYTGRAAKKLREEGFIPAELYGRGIDNVHIAIERTTFHRVYSEAGESTILNITVEDETRPVLIYDVQNDPITGDYMHVDLYQVRMDETIETEVPLVFSGESPAAKEEGGIVVESLRSLPIEALPANLPHEIEVDISSLVELDSTIYVRDLDLPEGVEPTIGDDTAVVSVVTPKEEEEEEVEEMAIEDIAVEGEEERAERAAAAEEGGEGEAAEVAKEEE